MATKYNSYAQKLNAAFQKAAQETRAAMDEYQKAEKNRKIKYTGEGEYQKAKANLARVKREIIPEFQKTRDQLTRELESEVNNDRTLNPDALDANAVALLNSGIAKVSDLEAMAERFADNATMSRYIGGKAKELAASEKDPTTAQRLHVISYNADNAGTGAVLKTWRDITNASRYYSGEIHRDASYESIANMNDHWNDTNIQDALKNF